MANSDPSIKGDEVWISVLPITNTLQHVIPLLGCFFDVKELIPIEEWRLAISRFVELAHH